MSSHTHSANDIAGVAPEHHRHSGLENDITQHRHYRTEDLTDRLREDLNTALQRIHDLEGDLKDLHQRVARLET